MNRIYLTLTIHAVGGDYRGLFGSLYESVEPWCDVATARETRGHDYEFRCSGDIAYGSTITYALLAQAKRLAPAGHAVTLTAEWTE